MPTKQQSTIPQSVLDAAKKVTVPENLTERGVMHAADEIRNLVPEALRPSIMGQPVKGTVAFYLDALGFIRIWPVEGNNNPAMKK